MTARRLHGAAGNPMAKAAIRRMFALVPTYLPAPRTVAAADLRTSMCDARAALTIAMGGQPDIDGYPVCEPEPVEPVQPTELVLFEVAA